MANVKLKNLFRYSRNGIDIDEVPVGTIIEGECAKVALSLKVGATTQSKEPVGYNDDGFVVVEAEPEDVDLTDVDDAKEQLKILGDDLDKTSEAIEVKKADLEGLVQQIETAEVVLAELKSAAGTSAKTEESKA